MNRDILGMHYPNAGYADHDALLHRVGQSGVTVLHQDLGRVRHLLDNGVATVHVRMYHPNWTVLDPASWAEGTARVVGSLLGHPRLVVSGFNEPNLHYECGEPDPSQQWRFRTAEHYDRVGRWYLAWARRLRQLEGGVTVGWGALAQGHDVVNADYGPDGEYQVPAIHDAVSACDVLMTHPYMHLDWDNGPDTMSGGADQFWHALRDIRPRGFKDNRDPGGARTQFPHLRYIVSETGTFTHDRAGWAAVNCAALRQQAEALARHGCELVTPFIWDTDAAHPTNKFSPEMRQAYIGLAPVRRHKEDTVSHDSLLANLKERLGPERVVDVSDRENRDSEWYPYRTRNLADITHHAVHHAAAWTDIDGLGRAHMDGNKWPGIGYHAFVDDDGRLYVTGKLEQSRFNVGNGNTRVVGLCFDGLLVDRSPSPAQVEAGRAWVAAVEETLGRRLELSPHRQWASTVCPGNTYDLWVRDLREAAPPPPPPPADDFAGVGPGVRDAMVARDDKPASPESYLGSVSLTVGRSGRLYVYTAATGVRVFQPD